MKPTRTLVVAAALAAAACQSDRATPGEPAPREVARVVVSPGTAGVEQGQTVKLTARVEDAAGDEIEDRAVDWFSHDPGVATVSASGVVTGVAPGTATITASLEGKRGNARVTVTAGGSGIQITSISPSPMIEGQTAMIHGSGFGHVASNLRVMIDGVNATIVSASMTAIEVVVPATGCKPARPVNVQVRMLASYSNVVSHPLRPAATLDLDVGHQILVRDPAEFCIQLDATVASEAYLIGVQSTAENWASLTPAVLTATTAAPPGAPIAALPLEDLDAARAAPPPPLTDWERERLRERAGELEARRRDRELLRRMAGRTGARPSIAASPSLPPSIGIGSAVAMRVPDWDNQCYEHTPITAVVRAVTPHAVLLEDVDNPAGGYTASQLQELIDLFENAVFHTIVDHFGPPSDQDGNGRIAILITKEINRIGAGLDTSFSLAAQAKAVDYFPTSTCPSSNEGEIIYLRTPDPGGVFGRPTDPAAGEMPVARVLLGHEFVHAIQLATGILGDYPVQPEWLWEGQATLGEEIVGHRVTGRAVGMNYGGAVVYGGGDPWYRAIRWMGYYFGFSDAGPRRSNAPEQCSWLGFTHDGDTGVCAAPDYLTYAVSWSFMRWLSDLVGPAAEKALHRALISNQQSGFAAISSAVGVPMDILLALWAAALYVDDRVPAAARELTFTSWDMFSIEARRHPNSRLVPRERGFASFTDEVAVRGGSTAYFRVSGAGRYATAIQALSPAGGPLPPHMRMWIVRLQ